MASTNGARTPEDVTATTEKEVLAFFNLISSSPDAKGFHEMLLANKSLREKNAKLITAYDQIFDTVEEKKKAWRDAQALSASKDEELVKIAVEKDKTATALERARRELEATSEGMTAQQRSLKEFESKLQNVETVLAQMTRERDSAVSAQELAERKQVDLKQQLEDKEKELKSKGTKLANLEKLSVRLSKKEPEDMCVVSPSPVGGRYG